MIRIPQALQTTNRNNDEQHMPATMKKLAALDIVLHGAKLITGEFVFTVLLSATLGVLSLDSFVRSASHSPFSLFVGVVFIGITLNYIPLLLYAISFSIHKNAKQAVAIELAQKVKHMRKYLWSSLSLFIPYVAFLLAVVQEWQKRTA